MNMKKFTSLLIGCSLALAGAALAQQPEEQASPKKEKPATEKTEKAEAKPGGKATKPEATAKPTGAMKEQGATTEQGAPKGRKAKATEKSATPAGTETGVSRQTNTGMTTEPAYGKHKGRAKSEAAAGAAASASGTPTASVAPGGKKAGAKAAAKAKASPSMTPAAAASASAAPTVAASASAAPSVAASASAGANVAATGGTTAHADPQKVQQVKQQVQTIKQQHASFRAQPRPDKVPAVTFNQSYRIQGSESWGPQYEVFRSYHPERHDRGWYSSRYTRVELIGGGYYYWNNGYWYPAWGYDPGAEYYAYDAPIYVGHRAEPPDRVIADVQAELQEMGYYRGEVDGLLGPLTREALTAYQADQGLTVTAVIDEPTLDSLGMS
jgi:hypothetical protein